ncbi:hypothetical protein Cyrtocomes_00485 [Candidatus Cyrtobacter comes]|uniref:Uncharacterized protein n=1 Tax=Candidatus Cyrtobacter comes TaxID=675776 RepID=A0ABU5L7L7_9RICK|nr:hypothetical protein [Candidatus Cyrtobacter comes]
MLGKAMSDFLYLKPISFGKSEEVFLLILLNLFIKMDERDLAPDIQHDI